MIQANDQLACIHVPRCRRAVKEKEGVPSSMKASMRPFRVLSIIAALAVLLAMGGNGMHWEGMHWNGMHLGVILPDSMHWW